jgi:hypothetical protein
MEKTRLPIEYPLRIAIGIYIERILSMVAVAAIILTVFISGVLVVKGIAFLWNYITEPSFSPSVPGMGEGLDWMCLLAIYYVIIFILGRRYLTRHHHHYLDRDSW